MKNIPALLLTVFTIGMFPAGGTRADPFPVSVRVDASSDRGELRPIWRFFPT